MIEETKELDLGFSSPQIEKCNSPVKNNGDENVKGKVTANDIYQLLAQKYSSTREWVIAGEVQRTTGWSDRRYDFVAMNCFASTGYRIEVVEIKISKPDLRRELEEPEKHNVIFEQIDYYSLAAPAEIIDMSIIPPKWGVYAVKDGKLITKRKPLALNDDADRRIKRSFAASFLRAAISQNLEKKLLHDKLKESFNNGYEKGKQDCGWNGSKQEQYEQLLKERNEYMSILNQLGFPVYWSNRMESEKDAHLVYLKKCKEVVDRLNVDSLKYSVDAFDNRVQAMKTALATLGEIQRKAVSTPLQPNVQV